MIKTIPLQSGEEVHLCDICGAADPVKKGLRDCAINTNVSLPVDIKIGQEIQLHWLRIGVGGELLEITPLHTRRVTRIYFVPGNRPLKTGQYDYTVKNHEVCLELSLPDKSGHICMPLRHLELWRKGNLAKLQEAGIVPD